MATVEAIKLTIMNNGIHCGGCESRIENALARLPGVHTVKADRRTQQVQFTLAQGATSLGEVIEKLEYLGYHAALSGGTLR